jgi:hypothetical protein
MTRAQTIAADIGQALAEQPVIDTHEHTRSVVAGEIKGIGDLMGRSYVRACFRAATGAPNSLGKVMEREMPTSWSEAGPVLDQIRTNSFWHWFERGVCELHGLGPDAHIDADTWDTLTASIARAHRSPAWLAKMLDTAHIETVLWDPYWAVGTLDMPEARFRPSPRVDSAMSAFHPAASDYENNNLARDRAAEYGMEIGDVGALERLIDRVFEESVKIGGKSLKLAQAYQRTLHLGNATRADAEAAFGTPPDQISDKNRLAFGDYMLRYQIERAIDLGLVLQIHTGMARLVDSNPVLLEPMLQQYPRLVVDLFHGGYPWVREFGAISHAYPNVRLNLVWLPQLTYDGGVAALKEWIQIVPQISRLAWGGDCRTPEEMYGSLLGGKATIARALGELVDDGYIQTSDALRVGRSILYDGPKQTYGLAN